MSTVSATTAATVPTITNTEHPVHHPTYAPHIPTSAVGPVTIAIIVALVLITCCILHCSRIRQSINNRIISERCRKIQQQHEQQYDCSSNDGTVYNGNNHQSSPSLGSWSSSASTVHYDSQQLQQQQGKDHIESQNHRHEEIPYNSEGTTPVHHEQQEQHLNYPQLTSVIVQQPPVAVTRPTSQ
ncbi:hypothetical protein BDB00DRAFT_927123 [Zychaea mexicana]|uniref:uncharacterized protein n=1 Tax=Zychaea mexicana TaxID=64656 RepID=UPI0022FDCFD0|nr:uncharacterized protein BDB00DRAFT_927123 [Zychaea mexicana]KAI9495761.1 hypothetical protein BDB00DRAFT_927123 [Zychaea mexicana]